jgi:uncharacterized glyoxalase superfamily protein PhnB
MSIDSADVSEHPSVPDQGVVTGIGYVRIPAPELHGLAEFYKSTFGMQQIGALLDHAIMLNVGKTADEAIANRAPRLILDRRMKSNQQYGPNDNNCWTFMTKGIEHIIQRAEENGATIVMRPYSTVSQTGMVAGKFRDPAGNHIDLMEIGTDTSERLYLKSAGK